MSESLCRLSFGMSPCPNDTHAFWAALHGEVAAAAPGFSLDLALLDDIEALNCRATGDSASRLDVTKLSVPALARVVDDYAVLDAGAALGFACGPLVVQRGDEARLRADPDASLASLRGRRVAIPGQNTTAFLLFRMLAGADFEFVPMRFEQILPAVARGECDAGLVIHESRFTYRQLGLACAADLGELWERATRGPLPLGVIAIRRSLGARAHAAASRLLRESVLRANARPADARAFVREHSQEMADDVCDRHIALYVNERTVDLGAEGRAAIDAMLSRGRAIGLLPAGRSPWMDGA